MSFVILLLHALSVASKFLIESYVLASLHSVIPFNSRKELESGLTTIFDKEAKTSYDEHEFFLAKDEGEETSERGLNTFKITITDCRCWIDGRWSVRFLNAKALSPHGDKDYE
ncbi:hypothetical protein Tco_0130595, partial [Tanacetum coccineum]